VPTVGKTSSTLETSLHPQKKALIHVNVQKWLLRERSNRPAAEPIMDDIGLRKDVLDELEFEPSVDARHIGVTVSNGVVTLTGHVGSYAERGAVERAVGRIKGVRGIAQEIQVRLPSNRRPTTMRSPNGPSRSLPGTPRSRPIASL